MIYHVRVERTVYHEVHVEAETPEQAAIDAMPLVRKQSDPTDFDLMGTLVVFDNPDYEGEELYDEEVYF